MVEMQPEFAEFPDGYLWLELIARNEALALELGTDVWTWLHQQVEHYRNGALTVEKERRRQGMRVVP